MNEKEKRFISNQLLTWSVHSKILSVAQEPGQKQMKDSDRSFFRTNIKNQIDKPFDGDICVLFVFASTVKNPPQVHKLVKNYMDLMHKKDSCDNLSEIVFHDDNQVRYIHALQYDSTYLKTEFDSSPIQPKVYITVMPFSCFRHMLYCVERFCPREENENQYEDDFSLEESYRNLQKSLGIEKIPNEVIDAVAVHDTWNKQERLLKCLKKTIYDIVPFFKTHQQDIFGQWMEKNGLERNFFEREPLNFLSLLSLEIPKIPQQKGDSVVFEENIKNQLSTFDSKILHSNQLRRSVTVQFFYFPPQSVSFSRDVDNIALKVIPMVLNWLSPPKFLQQSDKVLPKDCGVTEYEILQLPVNSRFPDGRLFFCFADQMNFKSLWDEGNKILGKIDSL